MANRLESETPKEIIYELPPRKASIVYRISKEPCENCRYLGSGISGQINFESSAGTNEVEISDEAGGKIFGYYTKPAPYVSGDKSNRIIDIAVFAYTKAEAKQMFDQALIESEKKRQESLKYIEENILPILEDIPSVVVTVGRGDVYDLERYPTPDSDIDLMLFTAFEFGDEESKNNFLKKLSMRLADKTELGVNYSYYEFHDGGFSATSRGLKQRNGSESVRLGLDVISFPSLLKMLEKASVGKTNSLVGEYARRALLDGQVLSDKSEEVFEDLRKRIRARLGM